MKWTHYKNILRVMLAAMAVGMLLLPMGCANRGLGPQGGPKDSIPPQLVKAIPDDGALRFKGKRVELRFDEYLQLESVADNVLISPPMHPAPDVKAVGKRVWVEFPDTLQPNTTYSLFFGNAICDYHEKIPLAGFHLCFSTGDRIDSLEVYGQVLNARDLNPVYGAVVGIHENLSDTALETMQFTRVSRTDSLGLFAVRNIREGTYRIYGLMDASRDNLYQPGEALAVYDEPITPYMVYDEHLDTLWTMRIDTISMDTTMLGGDSIVLGMNYQTDTIRTIDTVLTYFDTYMEPGNLVLWLYEENKQRQYFQRAFRDERHCIRLQFGAPQTQLPTLEADWADRVWWQVNPTQDTIMLWLRDTIDIQTDTLSFVLHYEKTDSLYRLQPQADSLKAVYKAPRMTDRLRAEMEQKAAARQLQVKGNGKSNFGANDTIRLTFDYPVDRFIADSMRLYHKQDTLFTPMEYRLQPCDSSHLRFLVVAPLAPGNMYELRIDSAAFIDIYGHACNQNKVQLKVRSMDEYSTLKVVMQPYLPEMMIELLDEKDNVLYTRPAVEGGTLFDYLDPKVYYVRMFLDANGDGRWTTGDKASGRQPEQVYYYPRRLHLRANWDFEETFDYTAVPQTESKPAALIRVHDGAKKKR